VPERVKSSGFVPIQSILGEFFAKKMVGDGGGIYLAFPRRIFYEKTNISFGALAVFCLFTLATNAFAGEADIKIPPLDTVKSPDWAVSAVPP